MSIWASVAGGMRGWSEDEHGSIPSDLYVDVASGGNISPLIRISAMSDPWHLDKPFDVQFYIDRPTARAMQEALTQALAHGSWDE